MVMVDKLYSSDGKITVSGLDVEGDNIFIRNDKLSSMGLIENMAQTAALGAGYFFIENDKPIKIGFIGAIKNLVITDWPKIGSQIITQVKETYSISSIKVVEGEIRLGDKIIASCELKIFLQD